MSMAIGSPQRERERGADLGAGASSSRVVLDDELLFDSGFHLMPLGQAHHGALQRGRVERQPVGHGAARHQCWAFSSTSILRLRSRTSTTSPGRSCADAMLSARPFTLKWRWLTSWRASRRELRQSEAVDDVVEAPLELLQQDGTGHALARSRPARSSAGTASRARHRCGAPSAWREAGCRSRSACGAAPGRADRAADRCACRRRSSVSALGALEVELGALTAAETADGTA